MSMLFRDTAVARRLARSPVAGGAAAAFVVLALAGCTPSAVATGQASDGRDGLYSFHTAAASGCPGLDWHVVIKPDGKVSGMVGWAGMTHTASLNGTIGANRDFKATATEAGTGKTATVTGTAGGTYINIAISGTGTPCDDVILNVPRAIGGVS